MKRWVGWILAMIMVMALASPLVAEEYFPPPGDSKGVIGGRNGEAWRLGIFDKLIFPQMSAPSGNPDANTGWLYVKDKGGTTTLYFEDDAGSVLELGSGTTTAWDDIGDPDADGTIAFAGYKQIISSTLNSAGAVLTMTNTTADLTADVSFIDFKYTDDGDANGYFMRGYDNAGGDLKWSIGADGAAVFGGITGSGAAINLNASSNFATNINTGTSTGTVSIGGGTNSVGIDSSAWDISTSGAVSGISTIFMSGDLTLANGKAVKGDTTINHTIAIQAYDVDGTAYVNSILITNANTPAIAVGSGVETLAIDTADWDISTTGDMTGIGAITMNGLLTGTLGETITGAAVNLNASSNFAVNIGTGTNNTAVTIGGGSDTVAVNSTTWDVDVAGAFTGVTGITFASGAATTITLAADGAADDLTISVTGAQNSSLVLASAGTAADALDVKTTAGGMLFTASGAMADQFKVSAAGTIAGNAINLVTTNGGIVLTAGGAANGDVTITAGDAFAMNATGTAAITSSDWGISTTGAATKLASVGFDSLSVIHCDTVSLSSANIKALRGTKKELVATPGAGYYIEVLSVVLIYDYDTAVYTESTDNLVVQYATSGDDITAAIEMTGFIDAAADTIMTVYPINPQPANAASDMANNAVELFNTGDGEFAGAGAGVMRVKITYIVHPTGL